MIVVVLVVGVALLLLVLCCCCLFGVLLVSLAVFVNLCVCHLVIVI